MTNKAGVQEGLFAEQVQAQVAHNARALWLASPVLAARFATLERLLAEPVTGRCVLLAARVLAARGVSLKAGRSGALPARTRGR